jgi:hypothetical protein
MKYDDDDDDILHSNLDCNIEEANESQSTVLSSKTFQELGSLKEVEPHAIGALDASSKISSLLFLNS